MKKLIAISVVFALVAGAAFAADVSAELIGMTDIIKGNTAKSYYSDGSTKPNDVEAGGWPGGLRRLRLDGSGENDEGIFGAWFRFEHYGYGGSPSWYGNVWWKPVEQVRFRLGGNPDGDFSADGVARWGFYQVGGDTNVIHESWRFGRSFYGGWGSNGGLLTITPADGVAINLGIPYSMGGKAQDVYMSSTLQVAYTAEGIGKFALTYKSGPGNREDVKDKKADPTDPDTIITTYNQIHDPGKLWLFAGLTMIESLEIDIGFGYTLPMTGKGIDTVYARPWEDEDKKEGIKIQVADGSYNRPMAIGLAAHYNAGDFGVKARTQLNLGGKYKDEGADAYKIPMIIDFDVLPYYNISESLSFLFSAGVAYTMKSANDVDKETDYAKMGFHVEPYITIKSSWWAPNLYTGIRIETDGRKYKDGSENKEGSTATAWSVPIGIVFAF